MIRVGMLCWSIFPYYDRKAQKKAFKKRPVLIIADQTNNDYTVLPVSTIKIKNNVDPEYDMGVDPTKYPKLGLKQFSYIRTHKQTPVHKAEITSVIGDMKSDYEDLWLEIITKMEVWNRKIVDNAL